MDHDDIDIDEPGEEWDAPFFDDGDSDDDDRPSPLRDRCLFRGECIASDPYHGPSQCWTPAHVEAYEAELREGELGAGDA